MFHMKHFDKFYEVGNNRYYTLVADDDLYIATESFINLGKKKLFRKQDYITQGFKLLKLTTPIAMLLNALENTSKVKGQKDVHKDMLKYEHIDNTLLKDNIEKNYKEVFTQQKVELDEWLETMKHEIENRISDGKSDVNSKEFKNKFAMYQEIHKEGIKALDRQNPLNSTLDLKCTEFAVNSMIRAMMKDGLEHLYTERVTAFANNVFLYEQDCFGTITIYRIMTVKNVVKTIDTFIYDKNLVGILLKTMYENDL